MLLSRLKKNEAAGGNSVKKLDFAAEPPRHDEQVLKASEAHDLGFWLGFGDVASASFRVAEGRAGFFLTVDPGPSPWASIEFRLSRKGVAKGGFALGMIEAAASPASHLTAVLRVPDLCAPNGFADSGPAVLALTAEPRRIPFALAVPDGAGDARFPDPVLVLFLPRRRATLCVKQIALAPMR